MYIIDILELRSYVKNIHTGMIIHLLLLLLHILKLLKSSKFYHGEKIKEGQDMFIYVHRR